MTTIGTIFDDFYEELGTDLTAALGTADAADTTGETCLDPTDGSTPLDGDTGDHETLNECIDLAEGFLA
jgi:hypothetical protein